MINKIVQSMAEAMAGVRDGSVVLIGGFGSIGQPNALIEGLIEQGSKDLTVVANNSGVGHVGLAALLETGRVRKIVCSFPRTADPVVFEKLWREGRIELECVPQGTMAERMRAAGAGISRRSSRRPLSAPSLPPAKRNASRARPAAGRTTASSSGRGRSRCIRPA